MTTVGSATTRAKAAASNRTVKGDTPVAVPNAEPTKKQKTDTIMFLIMAGCIWREWRRSTGRG